MILQLSRIVPVLFFYIFLSLSSFLIFPSLVEGAVPSTVRLEPIHKNTETGLFSVFSIVNTGSALANYAVNFFWPNDEWVSGDNFQLEPGGGCTDPCNNICQPSVSYDMSSFPLGENHFTGYVLISSDQPLDACINTPFIDLMVSAGRMHTCGIKTDGTVVCWGAGLTDTEDPHFGQSNPPAKTFRQVSAGGYHTCGIKTDRTVACWGDNK